MTAGQTRGLAALAAVFAAPAAPAHAATHKITWPPEISRVWVASPGGYNECRPRGSPQAMSECKKFHSIPPGGVVPMAGTIWYIVRTTKFEFLIADYVIGPDQQTYRITVPTKVSANRRKPDQSILPPK